MTAHLNKYYIVCDLKFHQNKIHPNFEKHRDHFTCSSLITPGLLQHTFYLAEPRIYKSTPDCRRSKLSCQACTTRRWDHINLVLASLQWLQVCFGVQDCFLITLKFLQGLPQHCVWNCSHWYVLCHPQAEVICLFCWPSWKLKELSGPRGSESLKTKFYFRTFLDFVLLLLIFLFFTL